MVSELTFYSVNPSSTPADACKICVKKNENKLKEAGVGLFLKENQAGIGPL